MVWTDVGGPMPVKVRYGIQRTGDEHWWAGGNAWSVKAAPARWFDSLTEAELAGCRDLPQTFKGWRVRIIPESAY